MLGDFNHGLLSSMGVSVAKERLTIIKWIQQNKEGRVQDSKKVRVKGKKRKEKEKEKETEKDKEKEKEQEKPEVKLYLVEADYDLFLFILDVFPHPPHFSNKKLIATK